MEAPLHTCNGGGAENCQHLRCRRLFIEPKRVGRGITGFNGFTMIHSFWAETAFMCLIICSSRGEKSFILPLSIDSYHHCLQNLPHPHRTDSYSGVPVWGNEHMFYTINRICFSQQCFCWQGPLRLSHWFLPSAKPHGQQEAFRVREGGKGTIWVGW